MSRFPACLCRVTFTYCCTLQDMNGTKFIITNTGFWVKFNLFCCGNMNVGTYCRIRVAVISNAKFVNGKDED